MKLINDYALMICEYFDRYPQKIMANGEPVLLVKDNLGLNTAIGFNNGCVKIVVQNLLIREVTSVHSHVGAVSALCLGCDERSALLATGGLDGKVFLYRNEMGCWNPVFKYVCGTEITSVALSSDGKTFAFATIGCVRVYEQREDGYEYQTEIDQNGRCRCCFASNDLVVVDGSGQLFLYDSNWDEKGETINIARHEVKGITACSDSVAVVDTYYSEKRDVVRVFGIDTKRLYEIWPKSIRSIANIFLKSPTMELCIYSFKGMDNETVKISEEKYMETEDHRWIQRNA